MVRSWLAVFAVIFSGCGKAESPASVAGGPDAAPGSGDSGGPPSYVGGPSGCGLSSAAFCDTFDKPSTTRGRAGDLNPLTWSAGRFSPLIPTSGTGNVFPIGAATIPSCRSGLSAQVFPDNDTLICDPSMTLQSSHLLVAAAVQNYGVNSYRIRQPFDFTGRTGKIVFDADGSASVGLPLMNWLSVDVTEDPIAVPSFAEQVNSEGAVIPNNGFEVQFDDSCGACCGNPATQFSVSELHVFQKYVDTVQAPPSGSAVCLPVKSGMLNHFEIQVAQQQIKVYASAFSADGVKFAAAQLLLSATVSLPFSRGYVHISSHNHATIKYSTNHDVDAAIVRLDNVGFDGPIVTNWREYEVPDSLSSAKDPNTDPHNSTGTAVNIGYLAPDVATGPAATLRLSGVNLTGVQKARLAITSWYQDNPGDPVDTYVLKYRFNGRPWRDRSLTADEIAVMKGPTVVGVSGANPSILGGLGQMIDVQASDLVAGDNTLQFVTSNVPQNYPPGVANVDLIVSTQ
jgi:hypothetical protein